MLIINYFMNIIEENKTVLEFIKIVLIKNIGELITTGNHYLGFGTISQGIELIGAIIEDVDIEKMQVVKNSNFDTLRKSRRRFHNALKLFSNANYEKYCPLKMENEDYDLYENLRCGYSHQMRPLGQIAVTTSSETNNDKTKHLEIDPRTSKLIIVSEEFYKDFKEVCEKVILLIGEKRINHSKAYENFLSLIKYE